MTSTASVSAGVPHQPTPGRPDPDLTPRRLLLALAATLAVGPVVVIVAISFAALVFSGPLAVHTGLGVGLSLAGAAVLAIVVAATSSFRGMVATPQDSTAAIVALIAGTLATEVDVTAADGAGLLTVVAAVGLTTTLTGACFFLLGRFRLGGLVRFLPYPVIGGFLAGTGWLLVRGAIGVMADEAPGLTNLANFTRGEMLVRWLPGAVFAVVLLVVLRRVSHFLVLPGLLVGSTFLFYAVLWLTGTPIATARAMGLLLGPFPDEALWQPVALRALGGADWSLVGSQLPAMAPVVVVGVVALLLNATGLELALRRDVDLDRELRSAGVANVVGGLLGGLPGFQTLSLSSLGHRMVPDSRLVGLFCGGLCAATLWLGGTALAHLPKASVGGLLLFLGLAFLTEWVIDARRSLPRVDHAVVLVILVLIASVGFLESVGVGIVVAVALFVVNYSRVDVVRQALDGGSRRSQVDRPAEQLAVLDARGEAILVLELQGFLFFGTANGLLERLRRRLDEPAPVPLAWVVIDLERVSGLDSSAVLSFVKLRQLAETRRLGIVVTGLAAHVREQLVRGGFLPGSPTVTELAELDRGVQHCEDQVIAAAGVPLEVAPIPIRERLERVFRGRVDVAEVLAFFVRRELAPGEALMRRGESAESGIFVLEEGQVTVQLELDDGRAVRLRTMGPGSVLGEVELYLNAPRSASVLADRPVVAWQITARELRRLQEADPVLASRFHQFICRLLATRLEENHALLRDLLH